MKNAKTHLEKKDSLNRLLKSMIAVCCMAMVLCVMLLSTMQVAYCEDAAATTSDDPVSLISGVVSEIAGSVYSAARTVVVPLGIVGIVIGGLNLIIGGQQGGEKCRKWIWMSIAAIGLVALAPVLGKVISGAFSGTGTGNLSDYNQLV